MSSIDKDSLVPVTRATLPPEDRFIDHVRNIFASRNLTNQGNEVLTLENELQKFLGVKYVDVCSNGTLGLQLAIRLLEWNGKKIITTPFTYVATLTSLLWENCQPIFADIDPATLCINPVEVQTQLERHPDVAGIMPVHVFGNACNVKALREIADNYHVSMIYDAAHAFGSRLNGRSLLDFGDTAICSFHSTKLFHTVEGGCVVTHSEHARDRLRLLRAFGHMGDEYLDIGINAKLSELHAAMGLCMLPMVPQIISRRAELAAIYDKVLEMGENSHMRKPALVNGLEWNYAYYPIIFSTHNNMMRVLEKLAEYNIFPRRYFYPSLNTLHYIKGQSCPISEDISERILCMPYWPDMSEDLIYKIGSLTLSALSD